MSSTGSRTIEREREIRIAEQSLTDLERQQEAEFARLEEVAARLTERLAGIRAAAARPEVAQSEDARAVELVRRLEATEVPRKASVDELQEQALAARQEAVNVRSRVAERLRQLIRGYVDELNRFEKVLEEHDLQLQEHQVRLELERGRRERERQEREARDRTERAERERAERAGRERAERLAEGAARARTEREVPVSQQAAPSAQAPRQWPPPFVEPPMPNRLSTVTDRPARVRMQASVDLHSESNFFQGFSTNLSEGGLFVATVQMLARGTPVDLHFTLPGGKRIDAKGVVRWTREANDQTPDVFPGVGVQFTEISPDAAAAIRAFVAEREPIFFAD